MHIESVSFLEQPVRSVYKRPEHDSSGWLIGGYAPVVYRTRPIVGVMSKEEKVEVERMVNEFVHFSGLLSCRGVYLRLDAYLGEDGKLTILEVNSTSSDGWGQGWHLARISGKPFDFADALFPRVWTTYDPRFEPALRLTCEELKLVGREVALINWNDAKVTDEHVFAYLQNSPWAYPGHFFPRYRILEDKLRFARFSRYWTGERIKAPQHHWFETRVLRGLIREMGNIVFKPRSKESASNKDSVIFTKAGNAPSDLVCGLAYLRGDVIAQELVSTKKTANNEPIQVILLCAPTGDGARLMLAGGYLQIAPDGTRVINDTAAHGPLWVEE